MDTPFHKIARDISPAMRVLGTDVTVDITGTSIYYIRVTVGEEDGYGYSRDNIYESGIINNAVLIYPLNEIEMFDKVQDSTAEVNYINLNEILPITLITKFEGSGIIGLESGDIIVDVVEDEHGYKVPIKLEVERQTGNFNEKFLVARQYELSLVRGEIDTGVELGIAAYIDGLE